MDFDPNILLWIPVLLFSLSLHEAAHAWTAKRAGDMTAADQGRITLNPVSHIDPIGTVILPLILYFTGNPLFGWARPVPFNEAYLRKPAWVMWIALAGPASNLLILLVTVIAVKIALLAGGDSAVLAFVKSYENAGGGVGSTLFGLAWLFIQLNLLLTIFNLLPIPPLDGSKLLYHYVVRGTANQNIWHAWVFLNQFGFILLFMLLTLPAFSGALWAAYNFPLKLIVEFLLP